MRRSSRGAFKSSSPQRSGTRWSPEPSWTWCVSLTTVVACSMSWTPIVNLAQGTCRSSPRRLWALTRGVWRKHCRTAAWPDCLSSKARPERLAVSTSTFVLRVWRFLNIHFRKCFDDVLFAAPVAGAIVLPLMIFHQMQLMVCGVLAQRYARRGMASEPAPPATDVPRSGPA